MGAITRLITIVFIVALCGYWCMAVAQKPPPSYWRELHAAEQLIGQDQAQQALAKLKILNQTKLDFRSAIATARSYAALNNPRMSLLYYRIARSKAGSNPTFHRIAWFGIGKMQLWLGGYKQAQTTYRTILQHPLDRHDRELALQGLVNSLSFADKPMQAYAIGERAAPFVQPGLALATARAALWAGWPFHAKHILDTHALILHKVNPSSRMARHIHELQRDIDAETLPYFLLSGFHHEKDSDKLEINKILFGVGWRFSPTATLKFITQRVFISQRDKHFNAQIYQLGQLWRQSKQLVWRLQAGSYVFHHWTPIIWHGSMSYRPGDTFQVQIYSLREVIETITAIEHKISAITVGITPHINFSHRFKLSGSFYGMHFSDRNSRYGFSVSGLWLVSTRLGLYVIPRVRYFNNSHTNTLGYFNPKRFHEESILVKLQRHLGGADWSYYVVAGPGVQTVTPGDTSPTFFFEAGIRGYIYRSVTLAVNVGYTNSDYQNTTGFNRHYANIALSIPF